MLIILLPVLVNYIFVVMLLSPRKEEISQNTKKKFCVLQSFQNKDLHINHSGSTFYSVCSKKEAMEVQAQIICV